METHTRPPSQQLQDHSNEVVRRCHCQFCSDVNLESRDGVKIEVGSGRSGCCYGASKGDKEKVVEEEEEGARGGRRQVIKGEETK